MMTHYVKKEEFDNKFHLKENVNNEFLTVLPYQSGFYIVEYNIKLYERFKKMLNFVHNPNIHKYISIIEYCMTHNCNSKQVLEKGLSDKLAISIDKDILKNLLKLKNKNTI